MFHLLKKMIIFGSVRVPQAQPSFTLIKALGTRIDVVSMKRYCIRKGLAMKYKLECSFKKIYAKDVHVIFKTSLRRFPHSPTHIT